MKMIISWWVIWLTSVMAGCRCTTTPIFDVSNEDIPRKTRTFTYVVEDELERRSSDERRYPNGSGTRRMNDETNKTSRVPLSFADIPRKRRTLKYVVEDESERQSEPHHSNDSGVRGINDEANKTSRKMLLSFTDIPRKSRTPTYVVKDDSERQSEQRHPHASGARGINDEADKTPRKVSPSFADVPRKSRTPTYVVEDKSDRRSEQRHCNGADVCGINDAADKTLSTASSSSSSFAESSKERKNWQSPSSTATSLPHSTSHNCEKCGVQFRFISDCRTHLWEEHNLASFQCDFCDIGGFYEKWKFNQHVRRVHPDVEIVGEEVEEMVMGRNRVRCMACGSDFENLGTLESHALKVHPKLKLMECDACHATFRRKKSLSAHVNDVHRDRALACVYCKRKFMRSDVARGHEAVCWKKRECGVSTTMTMAQLKNEERASFYRFKTRTCQDCSLQFDCHSKYAKHRRRLHRDTKVYPCEFCTAGFSYKDKLYAHYDEYHENDTSKMMTRKFLKFLTYKCAVCSLPFPGLTKYEAHGRQQHPGQSLFHCGDCGKGVVKKWHMVRHLELCHAAGLTERHRFRCGDCGKGYLRVRDFRLHEGKCAGVVKEKIRSNIAN